MTESSPHRVQLEAMRARVREVSCPTCLAGPGENCKGRTGERKSNHRDRVEQAKLGWSVWRATHPGRCAKCQGAIWPNQGIRRLAGKWAHVDC